MPSGVTYLVDHDGLNGAGGLHRLDAAVDVEFQ